MNCTLSAFLRKNQCAVTKKLLAVNRRENLVHYLDRLPSASIRTWLATSFSSFNTLQCTQLCAAGGHSNANGAVATTSAEQSNVPIHLIGAVTFQLTFKALLFQLTANICTPVVALIAPPWRHQRCQLWLPGLFVPCQHHPCNQATNIPRGTSTQIVLLLSKLLLHQRSVIHTTPNNSDYLMPREHTPFASSTCSRRTTWLIDGCHWFTRTAKGQPEFHVTETAACKMYPCILASTALCTWHEAHSVATYGPVTSLPRPKELRIVSRISMHFFADTVVDDF